VGCVRLQHTKKSSACDVSISRVGVGKNLSLIPVYYMSVML
jgi:hypothetical protein